MRKLLAILILLSLPAASFAGTVTLPYTGTMSPSTEWSTWGLWYSDSLQFTTDPDNNGPDPSTVMRFKFPVGFADGNAPANASVTFLSSNASTLYIEYWFKHGTGYDWQSTVNKHFYIWDATNTVNMYGGVIGNGTGFKLDLQAPGGSKAILPTTYTSFTRGVWYQVQMKLTLNTGDNYDGAAQVWINGTQVINRTGLRYWTGATYFRHLAFTPVWGGVDGETVSTTSYLYFDLVRIQKTPFGEESDTTPPAVGTFSPADGATGVAVGTTSFSFHVTDPGTGASGVDNSTISLSCGALGGTTAIAGTSSDYTVTRSGFTLAYDQAVSCTVNASDLDGNAMSAFAYNWTVEPESAPALNITTMFLPTTTVGSPVVGAISVEGGTSPFACDNLTVMPAGMSVPASCTESGASWGIPTESGTSTFSIEITDAASTTDIEEISITVNPLLPGGQSVVTWADLSDTYVNSGASTTNYSDNVSLRTYQWPFGTVANKVIVSHATSGLPDNISITGATLRLRRTSGGGTDPMRIYARSVSGALDIATVTWDTFTNSTTQLSYQDIENTAEWVEWPVLEAVQAAYANSKADVILSVDGGSDSAQDSYRYFSSEEGSYPPELVITYTQLTEEGGPSIPAPGKLRVSGRFTFGGK